MMPHSSLISVARLAVVLLWSALLIPGRVDADAVPPPPDKCPKGYQGITSHHGPECVAPPPKDCPAGWRPEIRGVCRLEGCQADADCGEGKQCREADLCLQEYLQEWGYGQLEQPPQTSHLYAAPPHKLDPPRRVILQVDVCGNGRGCPEASKCGRGKICLPKGVSRPGIWKGATARP